MKILNFIRMRKGSHLIHILKIVLIRHIDSNNKNTIKIRNDFYNLHLQKPYNCQIEVIIKII